MVSWLVFAAVLLARPALAADSREERLFGAAKEAFQISNWLRAEIQFGQFVESHPKSDRAPEAILMQARSRLKLDQFERAAELLSSNLNNAGFLSDEYQFWIAESHFKGSNYVAAAEAYDKVVNEFISSSRRVEAAFGQAMAFSKLGHHSRVVELLTKPDGVFAQAVNSSPGAEFVARGLLLLGETQLSQGDLAAAESALSPLSGQTLPPELEWQVRHLRSRILLAQDRTDEAWQTSTNLTALATGSPAESRPKLLAESVQFQAELLERLDRRDEAVAALRENLRDGIPPAQQRESLLKITKMLMALDRTTNAIQTLNQFLVQHSNSPAADMALLTLGELNLKRHATGEGGDGTNRLQLAAMRFDQLLERFPGSELTGRALLGKGWCVWLRGDATNSLPLFAAAAERLPFSQEQAVALFKLGDAQMALGDFANALTNYTRLTEAYATVKSVRSNLFEQALYQQARAAVRSGNMDAASDAVARVIEWFPNGLVGDQSLLMVGEGFLQRRNPARARELFSGVENRTDDPSRLADVQLAIARSFELEGDWSSAIGKYDEWLGTFTNNPAQPDARFFRAWATAQAGDETNALTLFTNFVAQFPTNEYAPAAQRWVGDHHFRRSNWLAAERNYQLLFQTWPGSSLANEARMMAGRAALARAQYSQAIPYFTSLTSDPNCPARLKTQALFAWCDTLMQQESAETNRAANLDLAIKLFGQIHLINPTNEQAALAWGRIGDCYLQLAAQDERFYTNALSAYQQTYDSPYASIAARSQAQVGAGLALEKWAATRTGPQQRELLTRALDYYLNVAQPNNILRDDEREDLFWVKKAGLEALRLTEALGDWEQHKNLCRWLGDRLPVLRPSLEKRRLRAEEQLAQKQN